MRRAVAICCYYRFWCLNIFACIVFLSYEKRVENHDTSVKQWLWRDVGREKEKGEERRGKNSLMKEQVNDKITSNELSGRDMCLMRTTEITSTQDKDTSDSAQYVRSFASLFPRDGEKTGLCAFVSVFGGWRNWRTSHLSSLCLPLTPSCHRDYDRRHCYNVDDSCNVTVR